ncbi:MAG: putative metal-binding motif-containing protein [Flavobacteriales bacterium]|nr:putative metal-binding motif-containing protein [Flavobacteriales bacterium]
MHNKHFLSALVLTMTLALSISAQQPVMVWHTIFGGSQDDHYPNGRCFLCTSQNNGFVWVGGSESNDGDVPGNNGSVDAFLIKHNNANEVSWTKNYGGTELDYVTAIRQTPDNGFIVLGTACSSDGDIPVNSEYCAVWVMDLGTGGNVQWQQLYSLTNTDNNHAEGIAIVDGGYVISGYNIDGQLKWFKKITTAGLTEWTTIVPSDMPGVVETIEATNDGGTIGVGPGGLVKLDIDGNIEWHHNSQVYTFYAYTSDAVFETSDGGFIFPRFNELNKIDSNGDLLWTTGVPEAIANRGPGRHFHISNVLPDAQGGFYATANWSSDIFGSILGSESALMHFDDNGMFQWVSEVDLTNAYLGDLIQLANGSIVAGGYALSEYNNGTFSYDGLLVRFEDPFLGTSTMDPLDLEVCAGEYITVNADAPDAWYPPYEIQLSDGTGNFADPIVLYSSPYGYTTGSQTNQCLIPDELPAGTGYRIRFVSLQNGQIGADNGEDITINSFLNPKFTENMGSVTSITTIAAHEAANGFHQDGFTMTGTGSVDNANPSNGYQGATGNANIYLGNTGAQTFQIEGINTQGNDVQYLQFGVYSPGPIVPAVSVAVSVDGVNYTNLTYSAPNSSGWSLETTNGTIPQTPNLRIRFTRTIVGGNARIDDIRLIQDPVNPQLEADGPTAFCGPGDVNLIAPSATSWLWSNGETTQTINVNATGNFTCTLGSPNGCDMTLGPLHVQTTAINYFTDEDQDGYGAGGTATLLCAPDATHTVTQGFDCDDQNPTVHIFADEICDGLDNDCNGQIDEDSDEDNDGYTTCQGDCDDTNPAINPGMFESDNVYTDNNYTDDNCNGIIDESNYDLNTYYLDSDGDLYGNPLLPFTDISLPDGCVTNFLDCDDTDSQINAGAIEICDDGKDNNCDGIVDNCPPPVCIGDLDGNGAVNIADLLIFTSVFGNTCN